MAEYDELVKRLEGMLPYMLESWRGPIAEAAAAIRALQQQGQWRLKPLEWVEERPGLWQARNDFGRYWYYANDDGFFWTSYDREEARADSLEAARAGAEAAYADDVREAYFLPPTT